MKSRSFAFALMLAGTFVTGCAADAEATDDDELEEVTGVSEDALTRHCRANYGSEQKFFDLKRKANIVVEALPCIEQSSDGLFVRGQIELEWRNPLIALGDKSKKFHSFIVEGSVMDGRVTKKRFTCNKTSALNGDWTGKTVCTSPWYRANGRGTHLSTGGTIVYDIQEDGKDDLRWELEPSFSESDVTW